MRDLRGTSSESDDSFGGGSVDGFDDGADANVQHAFYLLFLSLKGIRKPRSPDHQPLGNADRDNYHNESKQKIPIGDFIKRL